MFNRRKINSELYSLPFDQFSRQMYVSGMIDIVKEVTQKKRITVLDIGGYKGKTKEFQPNDNVTIADLFDATEPDYVKVEPTGLPFDDNQFDVSVSFDTYEHVPRGNRKSFIAEAVRVSNTFHILAAPVDNAIRDVNAAEIKANESYRNVKGEDHRWLKEHIEYLIPTDAEIEQTFDSLGLSYVSIRTNELSLWLQLHQFFFCAEIHSKTFAQVEPINRFFNENMQLIEASIDQKVAYRSIYCVTDKVELFKAFNKAFELLKAEIYSPASKEKQTQLVLELDRLIHEGYLLLAKEQ